VIHNDKNDGEHQRIRTYRNMIYFYTHFNYKFIFFYVILYFVEVIYEMNKYLKYDTYI